MLKLKATPAVTSQGKEISRLFLSLLGLLLSDLSRQYLKLNNVGLKNFMEKFPEFSVTGEKG